MSNVEWNGVGLPPVGAKVITNYDHSGYESAQQAHNKEAVIVAHANNVAIFEYYHNGCKFYHGFYSGYFKPVKSERYKAIEEMSKTVIRAHANLIRELPIIDDISLAALYDAGYRKVEQ